MQRLLKGFRLREFAPHALLPCMTMTLPQRVGFAPRLSGAGLALRPEHYGNFVKTPQPVGWLELLTDNYLVPGGRPLHYLDRIRADYPVTLHGVAMNLGSTDPLDHNYLREVRQLADRVDPVFISDHVCFTGVLGRRLYDLLPLPYTEEAVAHIAGRIREAQDVLGRQLALENLSAYLEAKAPLKEWEFLAAVADSADCQILLDVNNVYVSSRNQGFDPIDYLEGVPVDRVVQFHLAGHSDYGDHLIDTHDQPVAEAVYALYAHALARFGPLPTLLERDDQIPPLEVLLEELDTIRRLMSGEISPGTESVPPVRIAE